MAKVNAPTGQAVVLKDSGGRREFGTGAVRDVQDGKGRMDLLPMRALREVSILYEAGCKKYGDRNWENGIDCHAFVDSGMRHLSKFAEGQTDEPHLVQACWNMLCLLDTVLRIRDGVLPESLMDLPFCDINLLSGPVTVSKPAPA